MRNKGITLISLVITIIIILILTGISIKLTFGENGIIKRAATAKQDYENAKIEEENSINKLVDTLVENKIPQFIKQAYCSDKYTDYIKISVQAEDKDCDKLKYTLKWGETQNYEMEPLIKEGENSEEVTFDIINLKSYKEYYWRVDVSDGKENVKGIEGMSKTYCSTIKCDEAKQNEKDCGSCGHSGTIKTYGKHTNLINHGGNSSYDHCSVCYNQKCTTKKAYWCGLCGADSGEYHSCAGCASTADSRAKSKLTSATCYSNVLSTSQCTTCKGNGKIIEYIKCGHQKETTHYYCEHGEDYTQEYHE